MSKNLLLFCVVGLVLGCARIIEPPYSPVVPVAEAEKTIAQYFRYAWMSPERRRWQITNVPGKFKMGPIKWYLKGTDYGIAMSPKYFVPKDSEEPIEYEIDAVLLAHNYNVIDAYLYNPPRELKVE